MTDRAPHDRPLVSVVIPFLNAERFIDEAIRSVFAQSYPEWELLLVDDGSSDGTSLIVRRWAEAHPGQVRYLAHENRAQRGQAASRNLGARQGKGALIAFLDADDVWLPRKLEMQTALLRAHPEAGLVYGLSQWWYSWTGRPEDGHRDFVHDLGVPANVPIRLPELIQRFFVLQDAAIPNTSNILVRREVFDRTGGFEEMAFHVYVDQAFYVKMAVHAPVIAASECWDRYRQHPDSLTAGVAKRGHEVASRRAFLDWLVQYLAAIGLKDSELWLDVQREAWRLGRIHTASVAQQGRALHRRITKRTSKLFPPPARRWLGAWWKGTDYTPPPGWVRFGSLRRVRPISRRFGYDRGRPIDRYYIERFLEANQTDVKGRVLEIGDDTYTRRFGGTRVIKSDVLDIDGGNPLATIVTDLARPQTMPEDAFDCVIVTQTLPFVYDVRAALTTIHRALKPGGVMLATVPGISQVSRYEMDRVGDYWRFTIRSVDLLCQEVFGRGHVETIAYGNVLTATAFLFGLAAHELDQAELDHSDPDYQLIITARAVKAPSPQAAA